MQLLSPATPWEAQRLADALGPSARYLSGATVVQQEWDDPRLAPDGITFINLMGWPQTQQITLEEEGLRIGAAARLETVRTNALVHAHAPLLCTALAQLGAPGVRRLGTIGGNVGWGVGDTGPVLLALDAEAELADGRREPLFLCLQRPVRPLMTAFWLPRADRHPPSRSVFEKVGYRAAFSPARIRLALRWSADGRAVARVAAGAPGTPVHRLLAVEALLDPAAASALPTLEGIRAACQASLPTELALIASRLIAGHAGCLANAAEG
ncbi:molybdopterin dehydrogenase [Corticibacter populi]|uniref:Molybdopterin dehydrogenase n=1 Tax=Corticibacter populi TaxID=1550736 RepID=A0A3M6R0A1_9BURK|nr:FAD binding domain-containing protein [Corticibacter populi]RMX08686.1 molybdopterin dehydrogenase [Corticibacter populi]RZS36028.1 xanthine dehydrogenase molybdenum-binding subunit [Corticibacter populi]